MKDMSNFRGTADARVKVKEGQKFFDIRLPPEDFVYGIPNKPSTPIKNVVCNTYAKEAEDLKKEKEAVLKVLVDEEPPRQDIRSQSHKEVHHRVNRKEEI